MNEIMTINDIQKVSIPKVSKTVCENVTFVAPLDTSTICLRGNRVENCTFRNCEFEMFSMNNLSLEIVDCVFEDCIFDSKAVCAVIYRCTFRNCTFPDGFKSTFVLWTSFFGCDYDDSFLESLSKEMVCPSSGEFVGWKKAYLCRCLNDSIAIKMYPVIVKLLIPSESRRSSALSNKCRCEKAMVLEVQTENGCKIDIPEDCFIASMFEFENAYTKREDWHVTMRFLETTYMPGEMVCAESFNTDPLIECGGGIHFFMTREEACKYIYY